jgi:spore coat protein A
MNLAIPMDEFDWPLMLQDKTFKPDGQLLDNLNKVDGGDTAVVNGKTYPYLAVEPSRFRILDASNSRFWRLRLMPLGLNKDGTVEVPPLKLAWLTG